MHTKHFVLNKGKTMQEKEIVFFFKKSEKNKCGKHHATIPLRTAEESILFFFYSNSFQRDWFVLLTFYA